METQMALSLSDKVKLIEQNIARVFVGKEDVVRLLVTGFISGLHVLIEDVPGVGKTTLARALSVSVGLDFTRIQFTPDLLPGDIVGMTVWSQEKKEFIFKEGAIMHQFILADEINRASPRSQSSLLEAMQESNVSVDGRTYPLPQPFFVVATENPSDFSGVFQLPEGEIDRFGISFSIGYPEKDEEKVVLSRFQESNPLFEVKPVMNPDEVIEIRSAVREIFVAEQLRDFIIDIVHGTRRSKYVRLGASPRAAQHLQLGAQAHAMLDGRKYVIPEDVVTLAPPVLAHRLVLSAESRLENASAHNVVRDVVKSCKIPVGI